MARNEFTIAQQRALALVPKFTAFISIPCSMAIVWEVLSDHRRGRGTNSIQRILVGMSVVDILASFAWFLSTWAVPRESGWAFAAGNRASCNFQGFLLQIAIGAPLYNSSLALFYTLIIKLRWTDKQLIRIERLVHAFILTFTIGTSILLLFLDQYNHVGAVCWVIGDPSDCGNSSFQPSDTPCERGNWAWVYGLALFYGPLWICVIACVGSMVLLYREVKETLRRASNYTTNYGASHSLGRSGNNSNKVAVQAFLYSFTFLITWMPSTLWSIAHWFQWSHFGLDIAAAAAEPLQGFWNFLIFLRSRPETTRKLRVALSVLLPCCCNPPPLPRNSSVLASSRFSENNLLRREGGEFDESAFMLSVKSMNRRLRAFAGSISRASTGNEVSVGMTDDGKFSDEHKANVAHPLTPFGILGDEGDNITSDLCNEEDAEYSGKSSRHQEIIEKKSESLENQVETLVEQHAGQVEEEQDADNQATEKIGNEVPND